jgi:DNA-binding transcriptional regulator GbsR (MarR family)
MAKQTKTQRINALLASNPELTAKEVAKKLGVTTNLVHQVKWQTKKNSEFVSKVFARAKMKPTPERSDDPKVIAAEDKYVDAVESLYKKPTRLLESVREMKTALDALDKIKDKPAKMFIQPDHMDDAHKLISERFETEYAKYKTTQSDLVNHPPHYKAGGVETIDFIEAKDLNYRLGNVVKYVTRAEKKGNPIEDLKKARWYLDREINARENA